MNKLANVTMLDGEVWVGETKPSTGTLLDRKTLRQQLIEFHAAVDQPVLTTPIVPSDERVRLRAALIIEEAFETIEAMLCIREYDRCDEFHDARRDIFLACKIAPIEVDMPELADGLADLDYVVEGTRLEFGIDGGPIADEVHRTNMTKTTGPILPNGKRGKPADFKAPDVLGELEKQGWKKG